MMKYKTDRRNLLENGCVSEWVRVGGEEEEEEKNNKLWYLPRFENGPNKKAESMRWAWLVSERFYDAVSMIFSLLWFMNYDDDFKCLN